MRFFVKRVRKDDVALESRARGDAFLKVRERGEWQSKTQLVEITAALGS